LTEGGNGTLALFEAECPNLAEAVEKVSGSKFLETMIQHEAHHRNKTVQKYAIVSDPYKNFGGSDFFNSLG
jgi:hypothetical protein